MIIRKATPADAAEIANVHISSWREAYVNLLPQDFLDKRPLNYKNRYDLWKRVTQEDKHTTFVAESADHGVVGFINGDKARDKKYEDHAEVWSLYLLKYYHGKKIGFELLKKYFEVRREQGYKKAYVWVLEGNPSIQFYEKTGARKAQDVKNDSIGGQAVVDLCYVWDNIHIEQR